MRKIAKTCPWTFWITNLNTDLSVLQDILKVLGQFGFAPVVQYFVFILNGD